MSAPTHPRSKSKMRIATLIVAWLVLVPIAVMVPSQTAAAAPPPESPFEALIGNSIAAERAAAPLTHGTRLSGGSVNLHANANANAFAAGALAAGGGAALLPTERRLPVPEFRIWPNESLNQVVNLESFVHITDGFEPKSWCICLWFFTLHFQSTPLRSIFEFRETDTGSRTKETCWGPGAPWVFGMEEASFPWCGHEWYHSSDVTGMVEAQARVEHLIVVTGDLNFFYFAQSRASDTKELDVGEVMSIGRTIALPVVDPSPGSDGGGFCSVWGISVVCWIGEQAADAALDALLLAAPFLREVKNFFDGCADAALDAVGGLVDILRELKDAVTNPLQFIDEKLGEFRDLIDALREDPEAFAREVLGDLAKLDVLEEEGVAVWLGQIICMLAIDYFTGKAAQSVVAAARTWLRNRRNNPDRPDPIDPNCLLSSFPGDTLVMMADGTTKRIESIQPGDWVLSHSVDTSVWEPGLVVAQWSHLDRGPPATATLSDGSQVTATDDHRFWLPEAASWTDLQDVRTGDALLSPTGPVSVASVDLGDPQLWLVWELTVTDNANFTVMVGDTPVLVHNERCPEVPGFPSIDDILADPSKLPRMPRFDEFFQRLTPEQFRRLWDDPDIRTRIENKIRGGNGNHEWCMVCETPRFQEWGLSIDDIQRWTTRTEDLRWTVPDDIPDIGGLPGGHGTTGSGTFHRELRDAIQNSTDLDDFRNRVDDLAERWNIDPSLVPDFE